MKFLADMNISPKTVAFVQALGHEATHLHEQGLQRMPDPAILVKAREEGRVLLTHDLDFAELVAASGAKLPSIVIFRLRSMRPERVNERLRAIVAEQLGVLERGAIVSVSEAQIRVRLLPIARNA